MKTEADRLGIYVCPACKRPLRREQDSLRCTSCSQLYPIAGSIPDFICEELSQSRDPVLRRMTAIDRMARIYETRLWYPVVLNLFCGFGSPSLPQLIGAVSQRIQSTQGRVLDVACGPGTFGRRVASPSREVFGVDVSAGMLRQGQAYAAEEGISNLHFARARVEAVPFGDAFFDAVLCCGALHLFADTVVALREMARVVKPGGILSVYTFTPGRGGLLKFRSVLEWSFRNHGLHVFDLPTMGRYLAASGFEEFRPEISGSTLLFSARRQAA